MTRIVPARPQHVADAQRIGVRTRGLDGSVETFFWFRNLWLGDLRREGDRERAADLLATVYTDRGRSAIVSYAIDPHRSDLEKRYVHLIHVPELWGLYVASEEVSPVTDRNTIMRAALDVLPYAIE